MTASGSKLLSNPSKLSTSLGTCGFSVLALLFLTIWSNVCTEKRRTSSAEDSNPEVENRNGITRSSWIVADLFEPSPASRERVRMPVRTRARDAAATRTVSLMSSRTLKVLPQIASRYFSYYTSMLACAMVRTMTCLPFRCFFPAQDPR